MTSIIPTAIRAIAHRRMAVAALRADSSISVRLKRYNNHMAKARDLATQSEPATCTVTQEDLRDVCTTLSMLAYTLAVIAAHGTPIERARQCARLAQESAQSCAAMVKTMAEQGGVQ